MSRHRPVILGWYLVWSCYFHMDQPISLRLIGYMETFLLGLGRSLWVKFLHTSTTVVRLSGSPSSTLRNPSWRAYSSLSAITGRPKKSLDIPATRRYRPTWCTLYIISSPHYNTIIYKTTPLYRFHANPKLYTTYAQTYTQPWSGPLYTVS